MITILNTSILTDFGHYSFEQISLKQAKVIASENEVLSAVGHQSTADILTSLLEIDVPMNRINYKQQAGDTALVFKLNGRPEEGKILSIDEIEAIGYSFGKLVRIA